MINLAYISFGTLTILLLIMMVLGGIDYRKKRLLKKKPFVSFLVPCYNDGRTVEQTITSIYDSYDSSNFELIVVDDKSFDNSHAVLERLKERWGFTLLTNQKNLGKSVSLNNLSEKAKSEILLFIDADVIVNKTAIYDMLARLEQDKIMAVSCPYNSRNTGFLALMQEIEYNMLSFMQGAHNLTSTLSLWGGCLAVRKSAFRKVGRFSLNAIVEDMDLALKLNKAGYKVQQTFVPIKTYVPNTYKEWYKQKIRWTSGGAQCLINHIGIWLKSPLSLIFIFLFSILSVIYIISVVKEAIFLNNVIYTLHLITESAAKLTHFELAGFYYYGGIILKNILSNLYFALFSIPYVIPMIKDIKQIYKVFYLVPFSLVYYPLFALVAMIGLVRGVLRYKSLKEAKRAW